MKILLNAQQVARSAWRAVLDEVEENGNVDEEDEGLDVGDEIEYQGRFWKIVKINKEDELLTLERTTQKGTPQTLSLTLADTIQVDEEE